MTYDDRQYFNEIYHLVHMLQKDNYYRFIGNYLKKLKNDTIERFEIADEKQK